MIYGQFCAMARALEVVGERWTLLVVRELMMGSSGFNEIRQGVPAIPRDTLTKRLRSLEAAGVVSRCDHGRSPRYELTDAGAALRPIVVELALWAQRWDRRDLLPEHLDPQVLLWDMHRRIDAQACPTDRVTIRFDLTDRDSNDRSMFLVLTAGRPELCRNDGGYPTDLVVATDTRALTRWWLGELSWSDAVRSRNIRIHGPTVLRRSFPSWFLGYALQ
jgi:DNA-binding HxlR family transcriptional regulator